MVLSPMGKPERLIRTSDPHIWAAGDCATSLFKGKSVRIESVGNAIDQAEVAALSMMSKDVIYTP